MQSFYKLITFYNQIWLIFILKKLFIEDDNSSSHVCIIIIFCYLYIFIVIQKFRG